MKWEVKFQELGGYDCMSDSYNIFDENDKEMCSIDCNREGEDKEAKRIAKLIVDAVNNSQNCPKTKESGKC